MLRRPFSRCTSLCARWIRTTLTSSGHAGLHCFPIALCESQMPTVLGRGMYARVSRRQRWTPQSRFALSKSGSRMCACGMVHARAVDFQCAFASHFCSPNYWLGIATHGDCYAFYLSSDLISPACWPPKSDLNCHDLQVRAQPGDLFIFNSEFLHDTPLIKDARSLRTVFNSFAGYSANSSDITVYA